MGFLTLAGGGPDIAISDHTKAVISFWFRVPQESLDAAQAQFISAVGGVCASLSGDYDTNLPGVVPLVMFGENTTAVSGFDGFSAQQSPSFIGIQCGNTDALAWDCATITPPALAARLQLSDFYTDGATGGSNDNYNRADYFNFGLTSSWVCQTLPTGPETGQQSIPVTAGHWHHVLVSYDISNSQSAGGDPLTFTAANKFYWAFDDVNYNGRYLYPSLIRAYDGSWEENDVFSNQCLCFPGTSGDIIFNPDGNTTTGNPIQSSSHDFGIPGRTAESSFIYKVEMAEFQMWTGQSLDTSDLSMRRLFVDPNGFPVDMSVAKGAFGTPDIALSGQSNWQAGISTGLAGNFTPTGTINPFTPGPSIGA
jgi:hypothetical protein